MGQPNFFTSKAPNNNLVPSRVDGQGGLWTSGGLNGSNYAAGYGTPAGTPNVATAAKAGSAFRASNTAAAALSAGLATIYTGLCLSNPAGSGVNLVVRKIVAMFGPAPATQINLGLITGWSAAGIITHTTPITSILPWYVGGAASGGSIVAPTANGLVDAACTLVGTPAWDRWIGASAVSTDPTVTVALDDDLIIPPGGYVAVGNLVAIASGFLGTIAWREVAP